MGPGPGLSEYDVLQSIVNERLQYSAYCLAWPRTRRLCRRFRGCAGCAISRRGGVGVARCELGGERERSIGDGGVTVDVSSGVVGVTGIGDAVPRACGARGRIRRGSCRRRFGDSTTTRGGELGIATAGVGTCSEVETCSGEESRIYLSLIADFFFALSAVSALPAARAALAAAAFSAACVFSTSSRVPDAFGIPRLVSRCGYVG